MSAKSSKKEVFDKIKELHPDLEIVSNHYENAKTRLLVRDEYGVCACLPDNLLRGKKPSIVSAADKVSYFEAKARKVHGDKYDYSLVEYVNNNTNIKIIGPNGVFEQQPNNHLQGNECPIEGRKKISNTMKNSSTGWSTSNWDKASKISKKFQFFTVYVVQFENPDNESFIKIGKTFRDLVQRFYSIPYKYTTIYTKVFDTARDASEYEQNLKNLNKRDSYVPSKQFNGMHECFKEVEIPELNLTISI
jgi:hypothetical protein